MNRVSCIRCACLALLLPALSGRSQPDARPQNDYRPPSDLAAKASEYMKARVRVTGFSGAVLVAHDGRPIFRRGYGLANHDLDVRNTPRTKFRIGSVTKQFTAAAILRLEERGKLKVTDPVRRHLPDWPAAWADVTLSHLLTHTGGLPRLTPHTHSDVGGLVRPAPLPRTVTLQELYQPGEELQPPDFKPGESWAYSNIGYIVLGIVIEKVSGKPYADFMQEELFRPLGMVDTGCEQSGQILERRATGYAREEGVLREGSYVDLRFPAAAGAVYSTVDDLLRWDRVLTSDRFLSTSSRDRLFTPVRNGYACGWWVGASPSGRKVQWHRGNIPGFVAIIARYPEEQLFVAVLSNMARTPVRSIANELAAIALGEPYELPYERKEVVVDPTRMDAYLGEYRKVGQPTDTLTFLRDGNRYMVQPAGVPPFELVPESPEKFFSRSIDFQLTFVRNDDGSVKHVVVRREAEASRWVKTR